METMITEDEVRANVSRNIARLLEERGRTPYWLMQQVNQTKSFYKITRGECIPTLALAARIADVLETTVDALLAELE